MSSYKFFWSPISLVSLNSLLSSANLNILPVTPSSKSLILVLVYYTKTKIGPSTDPRGTPLKTDFQLETYLSTNTAAISCQFTDLFLEPFE